MKTFIVLAAILLFASLASAAIINATSCSQTAVRAAIDSANDGDTIYVPDGNCTWSSTLTFTKGINLIGAGIGNTVITSNVSDFLLKYNPSDYTLNSPFRLSGFTFELAGNKGIEIGIDNKRAPFTVQDKFRIDYVRFSGCEDSAALWNHGVAYGVVNNNQFDHCNFPIHNDPGTGGDNWWDNAPQNLFASGSEKYLYYEDNIFTNVSGYSGGSDAGITNGQYNPRYVFRYNTIIADSDVDQDLLHGQQGNGPSDMMGPWGMEQYGNKFIVGAGKYVNYKFRGGKSFIFFNDATTNSLSVHAYWGVYSVCPDAYAADKIIHDTYVFGNRKNLSGALQTIEPPSTTGTCIGLSNIPTAGRDWFHNTSSPGVSCGPLASRPATCTTGQGYWATNQSCTDLTGMVGANPTTPINGTLYKCTSTNTWTLYYTPYPYPHPLRAEDGQPPMCTDSDGDGYGTGSGCLGPDCNDNNSSIHATIFCNYNGTVCGNYNLCASSCPQPPAENCTDSVDNDCDSLTDCLDPNCSTYSACLQCPQGQIKCNNVCTTPTCSSNMQCNDSNALTSDVCLNAGTCNASCSFTPYAGCGELIAANCNCGGSIYSSGLCCNSTYRAQATCSSDAQCNDQNSLTNDTCLNAGTCSASCSNTPINQPICVEGQTASCVTADLCVGTRTCANNAWGSCEKDYPDCPITPICTEGQTIECSTPDGCAGTRTCLNNDWTACTKLDPNCPKTVGPTDSDADGITSDKDCNDRNPNIKLCTGCAACSNGTCTPGNCPATTCTQKSECMGEHYYSYPSTVANECSLQGGLGTCSVKNCVPSISLNDSRCTILGQVTQPPEIPEQITEEPPAVEFVPLQVLAAAIILMAIGIISLAWVIKKH